ncbi:MAG: nucleotidyl transferase AbiEii/AbiGii toxin family protein, partial [Ignavibacteria bacterium]|nr:nucleotidyl transferase AbiEii/AbiGii toxin family protein [Ignavibacteria bacterium]
MKKLGTPKYDTSMNPLEKFYVEKLYPLQDGVIKIVNDLNLPFYLTGGTALSRYYLNHRYSDDLDFFINSDPAFKTYIKSFLDYFSQLTPDTPIKLITERISISDDYAQFFIYADKTELKLDFVNDLAIRFESILPDKKLGKVDSLRNILSNKISALYRFEIKDYADIWCIAKNYKFNWRQLINEAKQKEASVDPLDIISL